MEDTTVDNTAALLSGAMHTLLLHSKDYIFVKDLNLKYRAASQVVAEAAGMASSETMAGLDDADIFSQTVAQKYHEVDRYILRTGNMVECDAELMPGVKGKNQWIQVRKYPIRDAEGKICGIYGIGHDVTRLLALQEKFIQGNAMETFSFNIRQMDDVEWQTTQQELYQIPVREEVAREAEQYIPLVDGKSSRARSVLVAIANQVPDAGDRELLFRTCRLSHLCKAYQAGRFENKLRYRRRIGNAIHWVEMHTSMLPDPQTGEIIAFFYTQDIHALVVKDLIAHKIQETNYAMVAYYSLAEDCLSIVSAAVPTLAALDGSSYDNMLEYGIRVIVLPDEAESVCEKYRLQNIREKLKYKSVYTILFSIGKRDLSRPDKPYRYMKNDIFYLDSHKDILVFLLYDVTDVMRIL